MRAAARVPLLQVVKTAIAVVASWFLATLLLPNAMPVFAVVAAVIVVQPSVNQTYARAVERSFGVVVGVLVALAAVAVFGQHSWLVLAATVVALFVGWGLRLPPGSSAQIAISALLVLTIGAATPDYALIRIAETVLGAAVALVVNALLAPPLATAPVRAAVGRLARAEADRMEDLADLLESDPDRDTRDAALVRVRELRTLRNDAQEAITRGTDSLAFNPRRSRAKDQFERDQALFARLDPLVTRIVGMTRTFHDQWDASLSDEPLVEGIAEELRRAAHDLRLLVRHEETAANPKRQTTPAPEAEPTPAAALTRPIALPEPNIRHWVLLGALLEDLRRIREEVVGE